MILLAAFLSVALAAGQPHELVLFDFEDGIKGWWGNPWGGGECKVQLAPEAKFGKGALRVSFKDVKRGANGVSPFLPKDAAWRKYEWRYVSFWVRGCGKPCQVRFAILATGPDGQEIGYSRYVTIEGEQWQRVFIPVGSMFQRQRIPFSAARVRRLVFGGTGTCYYDIDHVCFYAPTHFIPLWPAGELGPAPIRPRLEHFPDDVYELCFDPTLFPADEIHVSATVAWPEEQALEFGGYMQGRGAESEARIKLPGHPAKGGTARLSLKIQERQGQVMYRGKFAYQVVVPRPIGPPSRWQIIPQPKRLEFHARYCKPGNLKPELPEAMRAGIDGDSGEIMERAWVQTGAGLPDTLPADKPEAYLLDITPSYALARGRGPRSLWWAEATRQRIAQAQSIIDASGRVPSVTVSDYPSLPVRGLSIPIPVSRWGYPNDPPVDPDFFIDFLDEFVIGLKLNLVVLILDQGVKLEGHPEVPGPAAWPKSTVARIIKHLRRAGVEVVPLLNCLGHANWLNASHKELREDGDLYTICTSHPAMREVLCGIIDEVVRLFQPRYFHIGMDEVRWKTLRVPPEKRCKLCAGKDKADIFAGQVRMLHDFLAERGIKTMMWGDMLLPAHNGGPPFNVARAITKIPRDVIICNWSTGVDPLSSWYFRSFGFQRVIKSNSLGCTPADVPLVWGNMWGCWDKIPWVVEKPSRYNNYNFLRIIAAANYSWNLHPDVFRGPFADDEFFNERRIALARMVLRHMRKPAEFYSWALQYAKAPLDENTSVEGQREIQAKELGLSVGKWVGLVVALKCSPEQLAVARERLKDKNAWNGAPVAQVIVRYADGGQEEISLRFGYHLRAAGSDHLPYVYAGVALNDRAQWYAIPLRNPRPGQRIVSVTIREDEAAGDVYLAACRLFAE